MFGSKFARAVAVVAISACAVVGATLPAAATPNGTDSHYQVTADANVHTDPSHTSRVVEIKHTGDIVTSPLPPCEGFLDPDGVTIWIEVNLATGGVGWMGLGHLRWFGGPCPGVVTAVSSSSR